jgi:hypothetical protein
MICIRNKGQNGRPAFHSIAGPVVPKRIEFWSVVGRQDTSFAFISYFEKDLLVESAWARLETMTIPSNIVGFYKRPYISRFREVAKIVPPLLFRWIAVLRWINLFRRRELIAFSPPRAPIIALLTYWTEVRNLGAEATRLEYHFLSENVSARHKKRRHEGFLPKNYARPTTQETHSQSTTLINKWYIDM